MRATRKVTGADAGVTAKSPPRRAKAARRDPEKRREQNRQSQKTYREKQKRRIEELERRAATAVPTTAPPSASSALSEEISYSYDHGIRDMFADIPDVIDPSILQQTSTDLVSTDVNLATLPQEFGQWLEDNRMTFPDGSDNHTELYFDCGCSVLHVRMPASPLLLPIQTMNPYINTLRLDVECTLSALLRNCLHLGIPKSSFCADESESFFYRPLIASAGPDPSSGVPDEATQLVASTRSMFRALKHDLRPLDSQIISSHHPYIDVLPFRDLRENLIRLSLEEAIDEDEFLHDFFNHAKCWGGARGSNGNGTPWESRSWEASEVFLRKWAAVVGGQDGELTRQSRWWRSMRGERVEEIL